MFLHNLLSQLERMNLDRFHAITERYANLRLGILGDFCLDRYLEIDPARTETSIETGLPVHNVVGVRAQPGGAGTILNNLCALKSATSIPSVSAGDDGEGYELSPRPRTAARSPPRVLFANRPAAHLHLLQATGPGPAKAAH